MNVAYVKATLTVGAQIALVNALEKWGPQVKNHHRSPNLGSGVNFGLDRYLPKEATVNVVGHGNLKCAWITKETNINSAEPTVREELYIPLALIKCFDGKLPILYGGDTKPTKIEF